MAKGYRPVNRDQPFLFPPDMRDWLPPDHPVWLVIGVVGGHLDTSAFHAARRTGGAGAAGYDPDMLVTLLAWAYANGVTSSRRIEQLCRTDVAFMVICGLDAPDHVTVARFRAGFPAAVAELFAQVLALCARLGMGRLAVVALDGTKIAASASRSANRAEDTLRKLAEEAVARHGETDAAEDGLFGQGRRGDEVPEDAWSPRRRDERIAAALAGLRAGRETAEQAETAKAQAYRARRAAGQRRGTPPARAAVAQAEEGLAAARAARAAQLAGLERSRTPGDARRGPHAGIDDYCRVRDAREKLERARQRAAGREARAAGQENNRKGPGPVRNITDPDSRLMKTRSGFIQGYNAQNVTSEDGLIIAAELTCDPADMTWFAPMLGQAERAAALITAHRAGAGHCPITGRSGCSWPTPDTCPGTT